MASEIVRQDHKISIFVGKASESLQDHDVDALSDIPLDTFKSITMQCPFLSHFEDSEIASLYDSLSNHTSEDDISEFTSFVGVQQLLQHLLDFGDTLQTKLDNIGLVSEGTTKADKAKLYCSYIIMKQALLSAR